MASGVPARASAKESSRLRTTAWAVPACGNELLETAMAVAMRSVPARRCTLVDPSAVVVVVGGGGGAPTQITKALKTASALGPELYAPTSHCDAAGYWPGPVAPGRL